jgi:hypothetical protein
MQKSRRKIRALSQIDTARADAAWRPAFDFQAATPEISSGSPLAAAEFNAQHTEMQTFCRGCCRVGDFGCQPAVKLAARSRFMRRPVTREVISVLSPLCGLAHL